MAFDFHLALWSGPGARTGSASRRAFERFVVSYDLWEEKFAVASLRKPQLRASGLTSAAISNWCLRQVALPAPRLETSDHVWVRLDVRAVENRREVDLAADEGLSLTNLIEVFSRTGRSGESRWTLESGAVPVAALRARAAALDPRETP